MDKNSAAFYFKACNSKFPHVYSDTKKRSIHQTVRYFILIATGALHVTAIEYFAQVQ